MDGYVLIPKGGGRPAWLYIISHAWLIHGDHAAAHRDIGRFVFGNGNVFAVEDESGGRLSRGCPVALHESRIAGKRNRCAGITLGDVDLEEAEGSSTVFEEYRKTSSPLRLPHGGGGRRCILCRGAESVAELPEGVVQHYYIIRHIRRDPHERISMDSLQ